MTINQDLISLNYNYYYYYYKCNVAITKGDNLINIQGKYEHSKLPIAFETIVH